MSNMFWGIFLTLLGLSILFNFSFFKIAIGLFLVYLGIKMIMGFNNFEYKYCKTNFCYKDVINIKKIIRNYKRYIAFSNAEIDLSEVVLTGIPSVIQFKCVASNVKIKINPEISTKFIIESVMSSNKFPDGSTLTNGHDTYCTGNCDKPELIIKIKTVFSNLEIFE